MRVFAVSDIHTDYKQNMEWVERLCSGGGGEYKQDVLLVAGDVSDDLDVLSKTLALLAATFREVFFVPGNHELWVRRHERGQYDSLGKLALVQAVCKRVGVHTEPACMEGVWIVPLLSWYHASWDKEPDIPGARSIESVMTDFHACSWTSLPGLRGSGDDSLAQHFDSLNDPGFQQLLRQLERQEAATGRRPPVLSFSHFLPRQELIPEKRMLFIPNLTKAAGSDYLLDRVQRLRPLAHVFGHTHFSWDASVDGIRYIQWPLGYPHEQSRRRDGGKGWLPTVLYDSSKGEGEQLTPRRSLYWSDYYSSIKRAPHVTTLAP